MPAINKPIIKSKVKKSIIPLKKRGIKNDVSSLSKVTNAQNKGQKGSKNNITKPQIAAVKTKTKLLRPWVVFGSKLRNESTCKYTHVSLFSGCGGFDLGFRQA